MSETEDKAVDTPRQGAVGPGERLQAARIKQGLSLEDVANRMHLSASILEALEENNFDEITAPIFVKGYLRAYARIVSLSEDEMIEQYVDFYSEEDPPISSTSNMVPELSATDARIKWTTYLVIIVLVVLLAAWWWNKQQNQEPPLSLDVPSSRSDVAAEAESGAENPSVESPGVESDIQAGSESEISAEVNAPTTPAASSESSDAEMTPAVDPVSDESITAISTSPGATSPGASSAANTTASTTDSGSTDDDATDGSAEDALTAADQASDSGAVPSVDTGSSNETESALEPVQALLGTREQPGRIAPSGSDKLQLIIHADTWADVKDSNNYQLVYDLLRADSSIELSGEAPFAVFLGNGHGIEIRFNGEEIGFANRIRDDNTARLEIGG